MGLFRRRQREPITHPPVERTIHLRSPVSALDAHLDRYAAAMGRNARELPMTAAASGPWIRMTFPASGVHPWEAINLAYWLLELGEVMLVSGPSPTFPGHWLVRAPVTAALFEGWTDTGEPITIDVPSNRVVREDLDVSEPPRSTADRLRAARVPSGGWIAINWLVVHSEDPGHDLAPTLQDAVPNRAALRPPGTAWLP
jgi:hypothetical protein